MNPCMIRKTYWVHLKVAGILLSVSQLKRCSHDRYEITDRTLLSKEWFNENSKLCSVKECCWYIHTYALEVRCRAPCFQVLPLSLKVVPVCLTHPPSLPHLKKKSNSRNRFTVNVLVRNSFHAPTRRLAEMVINSRPVLLPRQNVYWFVSVVIGP